MRGRHRHMIHFFNMPSVDHAGRGAGPRKSTSSPLQKRCDAQETVNNTIDALMWAFRSPSARRSRLRRALPCRSAASTRPSKLDADGSTDASARLHARVLTCIHKTLPRATNAQTPWRTPRPVPEPTDRDDTQTVAQVGGRTEFSHRGLPPPTSPGDARGEAIREQRARVPSAPREIHTWATGQSPHEAEKRSWMRAPSEVLEKSNYIPVKGRRNSTLSGWSRRARILARLRMACAACA